ncbi:MAG: universal stress protein [Hyphomicrobiaceae bacterium]
MSYRTILTYLPSSARASWLATAGATLARAHDAHLVGLVVTPDHTMPPAFGIEVPPQFLQSPKELREAERDATRALFEKAASEMDVEAEWRYVGNAQNLIADVVAEHALTADLVVMPQATGEEWGPWAELPERVILNAGRPVMVVPEALTVERAPERIVVAWTDSPQSARTTFDALPLLVRADSVEVLSVGVGRHGRADERSLAIDQVALVLARHGVNAAATSEIREGVESIGEIILDHVREAHADLLVMGCYSHSRFRESLLGGVSRTVLADASVPVVTAH